MAETWVSHSSVSAWCNPAMWPLYLSRAQFILGSRVTRLDASDPVVRKVTSLDEIGEYILSFNEFEQSRTLFGKFSSGTDFTIDLHRDDKRWTNSITWYFPSELVTELDNLRRVRAIFDLGNDVLSPFYSYADDQMVISGKKRSDRSVNILEELLGVFWLTYFGRAYVDFFGQARFSDVPEIQFYLSGGATLVLGESPHAVPGALRQEWVKRLGEQSFVDPAGPYWKQPGRHALGFDELAGQCDSIAPREE